ncbi:MAG: hypothetical protein GTO67_11005 [Gammaproteobacteria bacterium]|nr:hypothetical protein [Gammaproteobacteria bacterium]NIM72225.1 hypothetical protein [Gammaproteobacteria bacterium]NIN39140.1 hypothetical protein [Gammaproteobacteria bacterium]NIO23973.1 hypothetical protein [Gammaproteobacteria bacterium]NIO64625.1 hypothetical protein [Gammaproteobacteria bacterium]
MKHVHETGDGFVNLWPTILLKRVLPDADSANAELERLIEDLDERHRNLTTDYRSDNLFTMENAAAAWLRECVNITVADYFRHLGMNYDIRWSLQAWANVNRFGDYHDYHNHPHAYLSGTYYVRVPEDREKLETRSDLRPGRITLYDPRACANMTAIKGDPYVEPEYTIAPQPGLILLWPAFLNHFVHPNLSKQPRLSVSFNVMLKWSDDYLPAQS